MTASEINELRLLNKKLNQRLVRLEKTAGTSNDLTKTPQYRRLQELAQSEGVKKRTRTSGYRFKEKGLEKTDIKDLERLRRISKKAEVISSTQKGVKKAMEEIQKRFKKGGLNYSPEQINDLLEAKKSGVYQSLEKYFSSEDIFEILLVVNKSNVSDRLDQFLAEYAGYEMNEDLLREYLMTGDRRIFDEPKIRRPYGARTTTIR